MNKKELTGVFLIIAFLLVILGVVLFNQTNDKVYKDLLIINSKEVSISDISIEANSYYNEASLDYEVTNYDSLQTNCRLARDKFSLHSQGLREIISTINSDNELLELKKDMLEEEIIIDNSMYEACEHFESAARYYDIYYNTNVPTTDSSYDMGGQEIDAMNEKIREHDLAVNRYNSLLAEYTIKLEEKLE
jgi:hypothetical protein